ncbi:Phox homologous domain protein [Kalmanozyma brasiliensis GHG001]|uniref:Endosomal t-SNARE n=1 Tax=Kalmanozyma brasiliensis (strain GHG001) TaxID=1365824 RepID=V5EXK3_KALBG|nr:Phox homologous domain protein [Kalmanozyma brasiliensis GHG001]EST07219.1 Phox homologous domain protein [Kalmanozyma brasiliensis GHG001]
MAQAQPLQGISIPRYESRSGTASSYIVYAVVIQLPVRSWTVYRRYSEFVRLDKNLAASPNGPAATGSGEPGGAGRPPPRTLPPRERAREWKKTFSGFLSFASGDQSGDGFDDEVWLKERMQSLETYLKAIVMDEDAGWRESEAFKMFIEWPMSIRMVTATASSSTASPRVPRVTAAQRTPGSMPGALPPGTRTLGAPAPAAPRPPAEETDSTRPLNNTQLFQSQTDAMDQQDEQLLNLAAILRRQRQMGEAINQELGEQTELLSQLDSEVEGTQAKLSKADQKMDHFDGGKAKRKVGIGRKF